VAGADSTKRNDEDHGTVEVASDAPRSREETAPATFRQIPPIDDGFDHVTEEDGRCLQARDGWRGLGVSMRGLDHQHHGKYREDALDMRMCNNWFIAAVGDGAGSCPLSRLGAREATRAAVRAVEQFVRDDTASFGADDYAEQRLANLMHAGLRAAYDAVIRRAEGHHRAVQDYYTTLLLVVHGHFRDGSQVAATAQIGDGAICAFVDNGTDHADYVELAGADFADYAALAVFLNQVAPVEWPNRIRVVPLPTGTAAVMLLTDGISDDFIPLSGNLWRLMRALRESALPASSGEEALRHVRSVISYTLDGSFDDRTLLVVHRPLAPKGG
jgi:hypothetical protein